VLIKYKLGICSECGDYAPIVHKSKRLCHKCNEKAKRKRYAKNTLRRRKKKDISKEKDSEFYLRIWNSRPHTCFETGRYLGETPSTLFFHHVLRKSTYPEFRYSEWNIVILHPDVHQQVESNMDKCPKVKQYTEELKQKYNEGEL
jgi:5-methylcytosine-specific restriction endonuclease McrA